MKLKTAEAIASLYQDLMNAIPWDKITAPTPTFRKEHPYSKDEWFLEDGQLVIKWSRYIGCGEHESDTSYHQLDELFED